MENPIYGRSDVRRWIVFNCVGFMGILVQLAALRTLTCAVRIHYLPATAFSVEAAIVHNFFWHERWTWFDRVAGKSGGRIRRLLFFHLTNGALSMAGNLILMRFFAGTLGFPYLYANIFAIAICAIFNYLAGDRLVFRAVDPAVQRVAADKTRRFCRPALFAFPAALWILSLGAVRAEAAELQAATLKAWLDCVDSAEQRIATELASQQGFLALDFQNPAESARERHAVLLGDIPIRQMPASLNAGKKISVPDGMMHHWRGSVFIPGVHLDFVLSRISNPRAEDLHQEDVVDSRVLERSPGQLKLFLKLQRSKIVTVVYNTEHLVRYRHHGPGRASSSSVATKIAEIERGHGNREEEKPQGRDSGFLWRMNSYWRYQQVPGGVIVECESMTLSRSIPAILEYVIRPIIHSVARESMQRTLQSLRSRITRAANLRAATAES